MAKTKKMKRKQVSINVPYETYEWLVETGRWRDVKNTRLSIAGFILLETVDEAQKSKALTFASFIDRGLVTWSEFRLYARKKPEYRPDVEAEWYGRIARGIPDEPPRAFMGNAIMVDTPLDFGGVPSTRDSVDKLRDAAANTEKKRESKRPKGQSGHGKAG